MLPPYVGVGAGASSALPNAATSGRVRVFLHYGADHDICIAQPSVRGRCLAVACWHRTWCDCVDRGGVAGYRYADMAQSFFGLRPHNLRGKLFEQVRNDDSLSLPLGSVCHLSHHDFAWRAHNVLRPEPRWWGVRLRLPSRRTTVHGRRCGARLDLGSCVANRIDRGVCDCAIGLGGSARQTSVTPSMQASKSVVVATASRWQQPSLTPPVL